MSIYDEIIAERARQDAKWGEQNWPSVGTYCDARAPEIAAEVFEIPTEAQAKFMCQQATASGELTFAHIAIEELCEAVAAPDDVARRAELVQLAAVCVQWIEAIDRRAAK